MTPVISFLSQLIVDPIAKKDPFFAETVLDSLGASVANPTEASKAIAPPESRSNDDEDDWATLLVCMALTVFVLSAHINVDGALLLLPSSGYASELTYSTLFYLAATAAAMILITLCALILAARLPVAGLLLAMASLMMAGQVIIFLKLTWFLGIIIPAAFLWWAKFERNPRRWMILAVGVFLIVAMFLSGTFAHPISVLFEGRVTSILGTIVTILLASLMIGGMAHEITISASPTIRPATVAAYAVGLLALSLWLLWLNAVIRQIFKKQNS